MRRAVFLTQCVLETRPELFQVGNQKDLLEVPDQIDGSIRRWRPWLS
jgi:hypothetical protein